MDAQSKRFVISVVGSAISGALLILLIPSLFDSPGELRLGIVGALAVMTLGFGFIARHWRHTLRRSGNP